MDIDTQLTKLESFSNIANPSWWELFHRVVTNPLVEKALDETGTHEKRTRKLPASTMVLFVIAMGLFTEESSEQVFSAMLEGIRFHHPELDGAQPKKGGFVKPDTASDQSRLSRCFERFADPWPHRIHPARFSSVCA
jgi:hypothetical protein